MSSKRTERVSAVILEEMSMALLRLDDPRLRGVTITRVCVTKDLRIAHVHFSLIGDDEAIAAAGEAMLRAKGLFKRKLGENLDLRYMPELEFHHDKNPAHADRIERILHQIHEQQDGGGPEDGKDDDGTGD